MSSTYIGLPAIMAPGIAVVREVTTQGTHHLSAKISEAAPVKDGTLAAGIHVKSIEVEGNSVVGTVSTGAESSDYAIPQHEGAGPHEIRAKDGGALMWPGADHPVKVVHHPGNPATKYAEEPLNAFGPEFIAAMTAAARAAY